jgi:glycosyltransferase involved in cell wall biosynthesis
VDRILTEDLLQAIETLIVDPSLRDQFGRNGRARVERYFTLVHQAKAWSEYLRKYSRQPLRVGTSPRSGR